MEITTIVVFYGLNLSLLGRLREANIIFNKMAVMQVQFSEYTNMVFLEKISNVSERKICTAKRYNRGICWSQRIRIGVDLSGNGRRVITNLLSPFRKSKRQTVKKVNTKFILA